MLAGTAVSIFLGYGLLLFLSFSINSLLVIFTPTFGYYFFSSPIADSDFPE
jgi:hypothetical protein